LFDYEKALILQRLFVYRGITWEDSKELLEEVYYVWTNMQGDFLTYRR
jgi:hypothetical protein